MKKLIVVTLLLFGFTTFAQVEKKENEKTESREKMSPEERVQKEIKRMTKALDLTETQQREIKALLIDIQSKRAEGQKPTKEERNAMKEKINKILTPEQAATWKKILEERKEKMNEKKEGHSEEK